MRSAPLPPGWTQSPVLTEAFVFVASIASRSEQFPSSASESVVVVTSIVAAEAGVAAERANAQASESTAVARPRSVRTGLVPADRLALESHSRVHMQLP